MYKKKIENCYNCKKQCLDYHHILEMRQNDESQIIMDYEIDLIFNKCKKEKAMEQIKWDKLETHRTVENTVTTYIEKVLPEGVYVCPHCYGTGKAVIGHSFRDGDIYTICGMCKGTCEIRKCPKCNINPVPNLVTQQYCVDCHQKYMETIRYDFEQRCKDKGDL